MGVVGSVESVWRYPVKSMRGEELDEAFFGFAGVYGDRIWAFHSSKAHRGIPYLTGREQERMLLYQPRFRHYDRASKPVNLAEAESLGPGITPFYGDAADLAIDVETPSGDVIAIDDPALVEELGGDLVDQPILALLRSDRAMTDCRPVSLISLQTVTQLSEESGIALDKRRFRANVYLDLDNADGFQEDAYVGRKVKIGEKAVVSILERDPRCKMITLDPDTAEENAEILRTLTKNHARNAGVYAAVLVEGMIEQGDKIRLID